MSRIDTLLEEAGAEFRGHASQLPEQEWNTGSRQLMRGAGVALVAGAALLILFVPLAIWWASGDVQPFLAESPALQGEADVVVEGDDWIVGFHEEHIGGSDDINLCWEFVAMGRGPEGDDVSESGCERLEIPGFGVDHEDFNTLAWCCLRFELDDAWVWVVQDRPGTRGYIHVGFIQKGGGPAYTRYDGWRMPLSEVDAYVFEFSKDDPFDLIRHDLPYSGYPVWTRP